MNDSDRDEMAALEAQVATRDPDGHYPHWTERERARWCELARKASPAIRFAPSTEELARRFGAKSKR